jgi:hypothetical protein
MRIGLLLLVGLIFFFGGAQSTQADEQDEYHPYLSAKFFIDMGVYFPEREMSIRVDGSISGIASYVDFQQELGVRKSDETFALNAGWRFGKKWQLGLQYFEFSDSKTAALTEDIEWGDVVFQQGSSVSVGHDFELLRVFFARRFESNDHHEFGVGAGVHWIELGAFIEGNAIIAGGGNAFRSESVGITAPLPNIGGWYTYSISPDWALKARLDWLSVSIGEYDGTLINASFGVNYQAFKYAGIGLSYNIFSLDAGINKPSWRGAADIDYEGLYAFLSFYW